MKKTVRKKKLIIILMLAVGLVCMQNKAGARAGKNLSLKRKLFKVPLYFIPNQGQVNKKALFYAGTPAYTLWITKEGLVFDSKRIADTKDRMQEKNKIKIEKTGKADSLTREFTHSSTRFTRDVSRLTFIRANPNPEVVPLHLSEYKVNYLKGNERLKWRRNLSSSRGVLYKNIYDNIDLKVYGNDRQIEYDWIVKPGADPGNIRFAYQNVKGTKIDNEGNLIVETLSGELLHKKPGCYQDIDDMQIRVEINGDFEKIEKDTYGFRVGEYDENDTLVIDPLVLVYSTYLGGTDYDYITDIAVDGEGHVYLTGYTESKDFPTGKPYQGRFNGYYDVFVTKLSKEGDSLIYSTYIGGSEDEYGRGIAVDGSGCAYVTGDTYSSDFPTKSPFQAEFSGRSWRSDAFVVKLSPQGTALRYSTYLGGDETDSGRAIAIDSSGSAYVTGHTYSRNFPLKFPFQRKNGELYYDRDVFVTKFRPDGSRLLYSTYLGGSGSDSGKDIAVDGSGNAYITGDTSSKNFPLKHPFMAENQRGYFKVFLTKLSGAGRSLSYSTYLGGSGYDYANGIAVDDQGSAYVCGNTNSWDFPTKNSFQTYQGSTDLFVSKFSPDGATLKFSTYLGGSGTDSGIDLTIDGSKYVYLTGYTLSTDFPVTDAFRDTRPGGASDGFIARIMPEGDALAYSTFIGGTGDDSGAAIVVDQMGSVYVAGATSSADFPMQNPLQGYQGESDAFVAKLTYDMPPSLTITAPGAGESVAGTVNIRVEAADDKGIDRVDFYINNQLKSSDTAAPYNYAWETRGYVEGTCYIKVAAIDTRDCQTTSQIMVKVRKIVLTLRVSLCVEKAWIVKQDYIKIDLSVQNPENIPVAKFVIYKKELGGKFLVIKEFPGTELYAGSCTINDLSPGKGKTYTYKAVALDAGGAVIAVSNGQSISTTLRNSPLISRDFGKAPLYFIPNRGQVHKKAVFYAGTPGYTLWMTQEGLVFDSVRERNSENRMRRENKIKTKKTGRTGSRTHELTNSSTRVERDVSRLIFIKSNKNPQISAVAPTGYRVNYLKGKDQSAWRRHIPTSKAVRYGNLYQNIDLKIYGIERQIEYDWIVRPGGDPAGIKFVYKNVKSTRLDEKGNLLIETEFGELVHRKPVSYQVGAQHAVPGIPIDVEFKKLGQNTYGFYVGDYDKERTLVIDPVITVKYSTYLGGNGDDRGCAVAVDGKGCAYVAGNTYSTNFPLKNSYPGTCLGSSDIFVTKFSPSGSSLLYSTYIGGCRYDGVNDIALDQSGNAYITGCTLSLNFPTKNAFQRWLKITSYYDCYGQDAFVTKLSKDGSDLVYSTYIGGDDEDESYGIAVDNRGCAYITGFASWDFPTKNPLPGETPGWRNSFITKFSPAGNTLVYSTFYRLAGGGIAVDTYGNAYVYSGYNISKLSSSGRTVVYTASLDENSPISFSDICVDHKGCAYVAGYRWDSDLFANNSVQWGCGGGATDMCIAKLSKNGRSFEYVSFLGGSDREYSSGIAVDDRGCAYVTGTTYSADFPVKDPLQDVRGGGDNDSFVVKIDAAGKELEYSTYLGGRGNEDGAGIAVDKAGNAYVTGKTSSPDFPTYNAYQDYQYDSDAYVTKIHCDEPPAVSIISPAAGSLLSGPVTIRAKAEDDSGVSMVNFYIDNDLQHSDNQAPFTYRWDSFLFANGAHKIKAAVVDTAGQQAEDEIAVTSRNMMLTLRVSRQEEKAWLVSRSYGKIDLTVENSTELLAVRYIVYRKESFGFYRAIREIADSELQNGTYSFNDLYLEKGKIYIYQAKALDSKGVIIGISGEKSPAETGELHKFKTGRRTQAPVP